MRSVRPAILVIAILLSAIAGLVVGYLKGAEDWAGYSALSEAASTVTKLQELRKKNPDATIQLLETELDGLIARRAIYERGLRLVKYMSSNALDEKQLHYIAEYRRAHPSQIGDESMRSLVTDLLKRY
jgi:hypothetical protein